MTGCSISANCHFMLIAGCSPPLCRSCWSQAIHDFPFGDKDERCIWLRCVTLCHDNYTVTCHTCHTCHHPVQRWPMDLSLQSSGGRKPYYSHTTYQKREVQDARICFLLKFIFNLPHKTCVVCDQEPGQLNNINRPWLILDKGCSHKLLLPYGSDVASEMNLR